MPDGAARFVLIRETEKKVAWFGPFFIGDGSMSTS
jgi:hypothetical protein